MSTLLARLTKALPQGGCSNNRLTDSLTPGWLSFTTQK